MLYLNKSADVPGYDLLGAEYIRKKNTGVNEYGKKKLMS